MALMILNGSINIPPTILKMTSNVNPRILNGNKIIQARMNKKNRPRAIGQHSTKRMHHNSKTISVFMEIDFFTFFSKN
jgi:hypothetical protein